VLVDHALARAFDKGAIGQIVIEGEANPEIIETLDAPDPGPTPAATAAPPASAGPPASPGGDGGTATVSILPDSGTFQALDAPDEFAEDESQPDYSVNTLEIAVGTTVTWTNDDPTMIHTVTDVGGQFDSGFLQSGDSFSYTFSSPGEFEYFCTPHPWMRARIIVHLH
jgi:plastocyanin